jgi:hypothetical protein
VTIPLWVQSALDSVAPIESTCAPGELQRYAALCKRVHDYQLQIREDFCPAVDGFSDDGKEAVFLRALSVALGWGPAVSADLRAKREELQHLDAEILSRSEALADLLKRRQLIISTYPLADDLPDLWEALELAAQQFEAWNTVATPELSHAKESLRRLCINAQNQSRAGPDFADVLYELGTAAGTKQEKIALPPWASQKGDADMPRAMVYYMTTIDVGYPSVPKGFSLPNRALACLITVLGDRADGYTEDSVKQLRHRMGL